MTADGERWYMEEVVRLGELGYAHLMPSKFHAVRRHQIPKARYCVRNWRVARLRPTGEADKVHVLWWNGQR